MREKRISVVTPVFNGEEYIEKTIQSIMGQNYSNYEHIIMDGGSTDHTLEIVRCYQGKYPVKVITQKDDGMYDAIKRGFAIATGEIYAWLNADDTYMPWAFQIMNAAISDKVQWCTSINAWQNENDCFFMVYYPYLYRNKWIKRGYYDGRFLRCIQQEVTFFSASLWETAVPQNFSQYQFAGDYHLWKAFSKYAKLFTVDTIIGGFRYHSGQKSADHVAYYKEVGTSFDQSKVKQIFFSWIDRMYQILERKKELLRFEKDLSIFFK